MGSTSYKKGSALGPPYARDTPADQPQPRLGGPAPGRAVAEPERPDGAGAGRPAPGGQAARPGARPVHRACRAGPRPAAVRRPGRVLPGPYRERPRPRARHARPGGRARAWRDQLLPGPGPRSAASPARQGGDGRRTPTTSAVSTRSAPRASRSSRKRASPMSCASSTPRPRSCSGPPIPPGRAGGSTSSPTGCAWSTTGCCATPTTGPCRGCGAASCTGSWNATSSSARSSSPSTPPRRESRSHRHRSGTNPSRFERPGGSTFAEFLPIDHARRIGRITPQWCLVGESRPDSP